VSVVAGGAIVGTPSTAAPKADLKCKRESFLKEPGGGDLSEKEFRICTGDVVSKDGSTKLDVDVTLPANGKGPFPLIVMLHGLGGSKLSYQSNTVAGSGGRHHYNNLWFASKGYAVLTYTARGWKIRDEYPAGDILSESECRKTNVRSIDAIHPDELYGNFNPACYPQVAHTKYETADTQHLAGRLVDGTLMNNAVDVRRKIGVTGESYGGGQSWLLTRKNVWRSPKGKKVRVGAAIPIMGWTDIVDALAPGGTARDDNVPAKSLSTRESQPAGILNVYTNGFYSALQYASTQGSPPPYLDDWKDEFDEGEPYAGNPFVEDALHKLLKRRSAYYVGKDSRFDTPILTIQGWMDGVFTASQSIEMYNRLNKERETQDRARYPMRMYLGDWGHAMDLNKSAEWASIATLINPWFDHYLRGKAHRPEPMVFARETVCGGDPGDIFRAKTYEGLFGPEKSYAGATDTLHTPAEDPHAAVLTPTDTIQQNNGVPDRSCRVTDTDVDPDNIEILGAPLDEDENFMMVGLPEVTFTADPTHEEMYVAARLWDVDPGSEAGTEDDMQTLVTRGIFRLGSADAQEVSFQLFGNAYNFRPEHSIKLELTADESPSFRAWTGSGDDTGDIVITDPEVVVPGVDPDKQLPD
jgi:predicted acyl esterase